MHLRDAVEKGFGDFGASAAEHAWWPSPSPQPPFLSHAAGEEGGIMPRTFPLPPLPLPPRVRKRGEVSIAVAILRQRLSTLPLTRSSLARSAGEGLGVRVPPHLPPSAPAAPTNGAEEGRGKRSRGDSAPASVNAATDRITPLPQRGRGAGGEGAPAPSPFRPCRSHQWSGRGER